MSTHPANTATPGDPTSTQPGCLANWRLGCLVAGTALLLLVAAVLITRHVMEVRALARQEQQAKETFAPVLQRLEEAAAPSPRPDGPAEPQAGTGANPGTGAATGQPTTAPYDIDRTVRVLHEVDLALQQQGSLKDYLLYMARQDYRGVAPEVLQARKELLEVLLKLYARQVELEDQQALWSFSRAFVPLFSLLSVTEGKLTVSGVVDARIDQAQAKHLLEKLEIKLGEEEKLREDLRESEAELIRVVLGQAEVLPRYKEEWDRLCVLRDRAYLAAQEGSWDAVLAAAEAAIQAAPHEKEAHLLQAWALIERGSVRRGTPEEGLSLPSGSVPELLGSYISRHPASSAPALLLLGIWYERQGNLPEARLNLQQAATYYPQQATELQDMLNPYRARAFLRKSREGGYILDLYKATMLGAGWFSPDLQLARLHFEAGEVEAGRAKLMDHFARRRAQKQWDLILSDLKFCEKLLGQHYRLIFPEDAWLDLLIDDQLIGDGINVKVRNRSQRTLHNCTLVLCVQFTDMHPEDYETFTLRTEPAVVASDVTPFESLELNFDLYGQRKSVRDVVRHRAILVADEAVVWVDTEEYRLAEALVFRQQREQQRALRAAGGPGAVRDDAWTRLLGAVEQEVEQGAKIVVEEPELLGLKKGDVEIELPRLVSVLRPLFRLVVDQQILQPQRNEIGEKGIRLVFEQVAGSGKGTPRELTLLVDSLASELRLTWQRSDDGRWRFGGVSLGEGKAPAPEAPPVPGP